MSYESAAIATQEMKGLSQFRRPVGAIAVLALAAGLSGCGAQEQARPAESNTGSAAAAGFDSTSYDSWADKVLWLPQTKRDCAREQYAQVLKLHQSLKQ